MIRVLPVIALAGCDLVFGLETRDAGEVTPVADAAVDGSPDAAQVVCGGWGPVEPLGFNGLDPALREDGLEVLYARFDGTSFQIYRRTRTATGIAFGNEQVADDLSGPFDEADPALSRNGLVVMFQSNRGTAGGERQIFQAIRPNVSTGFAVAAVPPGLEAVFLGDGLDLSANALTLYFDRNGILEVAKRNGLGVPFGAPVFHAARARYPGIAESGLEIYSNLGNSLAVRTRPTASDAWGADVIFDADGLDGDLSADGQTLIYNDGTGIVIRRRSCAPPQPV
jgi:hypothetical protein